MQDIFDVIIIHYDEMGLKGGNRDFFIRQLVKNLQNKIKGAVVQPGARKIIIKNFLLEELSNIIEILKLTPGISNFSAAAVIESDWQKILATSLKVLNYYKPKTFKISAVREDKDFPLKSPEICREVGGFILENNQNTTVDIHAPELIIKIEVERYKTFILGTKEEGVGGLPVGTAGKLLCLLSGGIDSPVAAFEMMKRGAKISFVHFHNNTINKRGVESKIKRLVEKLSKIQGESSLTIIPFEDLQKEVIKNIPSEIRMLVYRRLMFKIAEKIAKKEKAKGLVTGDSLSQVASQTLENLNVIYESTPILKLAPLIGRNKIEIIDIARKIDTLTISEEPYGDCCSLLIAKHPETRGTIAKVLQAEEALGDIEKLMDDVVEQATRLQE